jgi:serine/threonine-protein kinase
LDHPAIVKVHGVGISDDVPWFAMELIEGRTLAQALAGDRPGRDVLLAVVGSLCEAVGYAHERGIVHRDLKPANVMIRASDGRPVIVELGLAKDLSSDLKLTLDGALSTTPSYSAPEVQKDPGAATAASDVFSLGVLLYEAMCGRLPFVARNAVDLLVQMETAAAPPPSSIDPASPVALDALCAKALARDPARRHANARQLHEALEAALTEQRREETKGLFARLRAKLFDK